MAAASTLRHMLANRNPYPTRSPIDGRAEKLAYLSKLYGNVNPMDKDVREKFPIFQALEEAGIDTFEDLMQMTFEDIDGLTYHYGIFGRYKKGLGLPCNL